jgi:hypothetical protein
VRELCIAFEHIGSEEALLLQLCHVELSGQITDQLPER